MHLPKTVLFTARY